AASGLAEVLSALPLYRGWRVVLACGIIASFSWSLGARAVTSSSPQARGHPSERRALDARGGGVDVGCLPGMSVQEVSDFGGGGPSPSGGGSAGGGHGDGGGGKGGQ